MTKERIDWLTDILARVRRSLASHRDNINHAEAHKVREIIAGVDAAALLTKEIKDEHTRSTDSTGT
jgi:hypothetical protein